MSTASRQQNKLFVEGTDDLFSIVHVIRKIKPTSPPAAETWFGGFKIEDCRNDVKALDAFLLRLAKFPDKRICLWHNLAHGEGKKEA